MLPYFKISENFDKTDRNITVDFEYHGSGGNLNVEYHVPRHPLQNIWLHANEERGYKTIDYNGKEQLGASLVQINTKHGKRHHAGNAFIKPVRDRHNLKILTNSYVTKITMFESNKTVNGVQFQHQGQTYIAKIKKEVILSAGAIASPQLLMLSGIGPAEHLDNIGIPVVEDLQVGCRLLDHPAFYGLYFDSNYTKKSKSLKENVEEYLKGYGSLTDPDNNDGIGFYQTKFEKEPNYPDLEIMMLPTDGFFETLHKRLVSRKVWKNLNGAKSFALYIIGLHSKSIGSVKLKSKDPFDYPLLDSRFLSDLNNVDIDTLYDGIKLALSLTDTRAFKRINATLVKQQIPPCEDKPYLSKSYWYCALRYFTGNLFHPVGTCPMGPDRHKGAVVNSETKVYGIKNLRVADASIFPFTLSGHPNAPCVMIGEKVSDLIKLQHL